MHTKGIVWWSNFMTTWECSCKQHDHVGEAVKDIVASILDREDQDKQKLNYKFPRRAWFKKYVMLPKFWTKYFG